MIVDRMENWNLYSFGPAWKRAFDFLGAVGPQLEDREYPIQGADIYAIVATYETADPERPVLEAHRKYVDIQAVLAGAEILEWAPADSLEIEIPYSDAKDAAFYSPARRSRARIEAHPGTFVVLFPGDAHRGQFVAGRAPQRVKKIVIKIRTDVLIRPG
jgi:YhcH/YjgK/YiaL family protein